MSSAVTLSQLSALSLFTEDLAASKAFYTKVFDIRIVFEDAESCAFRFAGKQLPDGTRASDDHSLIINLLSAPEAAQDLVKPGVVAPASAGKRFQFTVGVDNLDEHVQRLKKLGVEIVNGPETKPWGMRVVTFEDPAGHSWEVAQSVG